jgi:aminopeptidase YwaD
VGRIEHGRWLALFLLPVLLLLVGCGGGRPAQDPPATPALQASATATAAPARAALSPNGERILADVQRLASVSRPAGSAEEQQAAEFIAERLRKLGYEVTISEFAGGSQLGRTSSLTVGAATDGTIPSVVFIESGEGTVQGPLVFAGRGRAGEFPASARGAVVLVQRGDLTFTEKVANAQAVGALGAVIFNNEGGIFAGQLTTRAAIPVVSIAQTEGEALLGRLQGGEAIEARLHVGGVSDARSRNVIARPPGAECETVTGGHYDSVQAGPGANDNASGAATVLEIAAVIASKGEMRANCFVLFGGEEVGLLGSRDFVASLSPAARQKLEAMLNFDMVGFSAGGWQLIGSAEMQQRAKSLADSLGMQAVIAELRPTTSSDHASFRNVGVPVLMLYGGEDPQWHAPGDTVDRISAALLEQAARFGVAMLESLNAS